MASKTVTRSICELWTIMSIIRVKGMFLTIQSHNFGRSCLWVDALRSSTAVLLELKDIYYFSRSVLKVTKPWAIIINPSRKKRHLHCSDWLIVTTVPNALKSFSALLSLPERSTTGKRLYSRFWKRLHLYAVNFKPNSALLVAYLIQPSNWEKVLMLPCDCSEIDQNRSQITSKCGTNMEHEAQASVESLLNGHVGLWSKWAKAVKMHERFRTLIKALFSSFQAWL